VTRQASLWDRPSRPERDRSEELLQALRFHVERACLYEDHVLRDAERAEDFPLGSTECGAFWQLAASSFSHATYSRFLGAVVLLDWVRS
jgi:hypothetical protein